MYILISKHSNQVDSSRKHVPLTYLEKEKVWRVKSGLRVGHLVLDISRLSNNLKYFFAQVRSMTRIPVLLEPYRSLSHQTLALKERFQQLVSENVPKCYVTFE